MEANKIILFLVALFSFTFGHQCTFNNSGYYYDLTKIRDFGDLSMSTLKGQYYVQVCSEVISHCGTAQSSVCLKTHGENINEGNTNSAQWSVLRQEKPDEGVSIIYSNGDICGKDQSRRKTILNLECFIELSNQRQVNTLRTTNFISKIDDSDECTTIIDIKTPFGCAVNKKFFSDCKYRMNKGDCFQSSSFSDCHCAWCGEKCIATYEKCDEIGFEFQCNTTSRSSSLLHIGIFISFIALLLLLCLCVCVCMKRRNYKMSRIRQGIQLPTIQKRSIQEVAMEPLLQSNFPEMQQPQFVYVQVPMHNSNQQNPPYFAPQPFFLAPQFIQPETE